MFRQRKVEEPNQSLSLNLTSYEMEMLRWLAQKAGVNSPGEILEDFVADLSGSWRNGGSDERHHAFCWFQRRGYAEEHPYGYHEAMDWREDEVNF